MKSELCIREQPFPKVKSSAGNVVGSSSLEGLWLTLSTHGPAPSRRLISGCPFQLISVIFFLSCQKPLCLAISLSHPVWLPCILTSKGNYLGHRYISGIGSLLAWAFSPPNHSVDFSPIQICGGRTHHTKTSTCLISGISSLPCTTLIFDIF